MSLMQWCDGEIANAETFSAPLTSHALHYGTGVFEGIRAYNGRIFKSTEHSERLRMSGELLDMPLPYSVAEINAAKQRIEAALTARRQALAEAELQTQLKAEALLRDELFLDAEKLAMKSFASGSTVGGCHFGISVCI